MKIEDVFRKLKPIAGQDLDRIWIEYLLADSKTQRAIEDALRVSLARNLDETYEEREILLEPPPQEVAAGEYPLGVVHYGKEPVHPFGLREQEWLRHLGIFGITGSGKTNVAFLILLNFLRAGKPFLVLDWKRNYRDLLALPEAQEMLVFTVGREVCPFSFNPLIPPSGTQPTIWAKKLIEIICHAYFLGEGVAYLLQKAIDSVYRQYGVYEGGVHTYPTIRDVKDLLEGSKVRGREGSWMESTLRAMGTLCYGEVDRVLNQRKPFSIETLLQRNAILELDALTDTDKTFFIEALLLWLHHYRLAQDERETFKHAVIIEEAHHILLRKKQEVTGEEAVTDVILREIRELGEAVILIDQNPSLISKPALGNTYCTVAMNLKHRSDVKMIADCIMLDTAQARFLGKLDVGSAVVKLQGRWFEPFLVRFPLVHLKKGAVTDQEVRRRMETASGGFSWVFREPEPGIMAVEGVGNDVRSFRPGGKDTSVRRETDYATGDEKLMLSDIAARPSSITLRYSRLHINAYKGNILSSSLVSKGLCSFEYVNTGKGRAKVLTITEKGQRALGLEERQSDGREGGVEHKYWREKAVERLLALGYQVEREKAIGGGKTVDLVAETEGERVAVEVETGNSDAWANIRKDLDSGFDRVVSVALRDNLAEGLRAEVAALPPSERGKVEIHDRRSLGNLGLNWRPLGPPDRSSA